MRSHPCLAVILLAAASFAQTASVSPSCQSRPALQDEGDVVSRAELACEIPSDKEHPLPRKLIAAQEGEIGCEAGPRKILVAHYRAEPTAQFSMNDDRVLIAAKQDDEFEIVKVLESETAIVDGKLYSDSDFEQEFIEINGMHFLYIRTRISGSGGMVEHDVYTISSGHKLSIIPFPDVSKFTILKQNEELRNGGYRFAEGSFTFESGIYKPQDAECCPSLGDFHAQFKLEGKFKEDGRNHACEPDLKFVVAKEWRSHDR